MLPTLLSTLLATQAPAFELRSLSGQRVSLEDYRGRPVLLTFWATWCSACRTELAEMQRLHEAYQDDGLVVLAISIDNPKTQSKVKPTVRSQGWTFPVLLDPQTRVVTQFHPSKALPYFTFISEQGETLWVRTSFAKGDSCEMAALLQAHAGPMEPSVESYCESVGQPAPNATP